MPIDYRKRLERVYEAIHADPAATPSLDAMAELAGMSRFHFHRVFAAMTGETLAEAVRRIRLNGAAHALVQSSRPVAEVGRGHGYPNAASFSRAFRAAYGLTPAEFRKRGQALPAHLRSMRKGDSMFPVTLQHEEPRRLIGLTHIGPYIQINRTYARLGTELATRGLWPRVRSMAAIYFDDPLYTPADTLTSFAGVIVGADVPCAPPLEERAVAGGRHAVMSFTGPYTGLAAAYDWFFGPWLAESGEALRDAPSWELYVNSPMDTAPEDLQTLIFMPLEDAA